MGLWEEKSKVSLAPVIFFDELGDERRIELLNEKPIVDLEEFDANEVDSFVESQL